METTDQTKPSMKLGTTHNVDEWVATVKTLERGLKQNNEKVYLDFDIEVIQNAKALALGPIYVYNNKATETSVHKFKSLEEIKTFLKDKNYILYMLFWEVKIHKVDDDDYEPEIEYTFRGTIL